MNIILLGPPGSGKGTQSNLLAKKTLMQIISTGDLLRIYTKKSTKLSKYTENIMNQGKIIPNYISIKLMEKKLNNIKNISNLILDGFPRNIKQAKYLLKKKLKINFIIFLYLEEENIINRLLYRQIHKKSGRTYNILFNPPKMKNKDDITGESLIMRKDDNIHTIKKRLSEYTIHTKILYNWYNESSYYDDTKIIKINVNKNIKIIHKKIINIIYNK